MNGAELITKIQNGEIEIGTKLEYTFIDSNKNTIVRTCVVDTNNGGIGLFDHMRSISTVILINGTFEIVQ